MNCWQITVDNTPELQAGISIKEKEINKEVFRFIDTSKFWVRVVFKAEADKRESKIYSGEIRINSLNHPYIIQNDAFSEGNYDIILIESKQPVPYRVYGRGSMVINDEDDTVLLVKLCKGDVMQISDYGLIRCGTLLLDKFDIIKSLAD